MPYHLPQLLPSHPTHHDKSSYHPNTISSVVFSEMYQHVSQQTSPSQTQHINTPISSANMADPLPIGIGEPAGLQPPTDMQTLAVPAARNYAAAATAGTSADTSGATAVLRGAGTGKKIRISGVWQYFDLFDPPDAVGKNTRCNVRRSLPADGMLPACISMCGARSSMSRLTGRLESMAPGQAVF